MIPFAWVTEAKLSLTDQLMKRGAEQRAERLASQDSDDGDDFDDIHLNPTDEDA